MSAERCQFSFIPDEDNLINDSKDAVSFKIPLDPNDPNGIKPNVRAKKLKKTTAENVLVYMQEFGELKETLDVDDGPLTFNFFGYLLHSTVRRDWRAKKQENALDDTNDY